MQGTMKRRHPECVSFSMAEEGDSPVPVKRRRVCRESWKCLPNEMWAHILGFLSPAQCSTMSETCWTLHHLFYQTRRRVGYTLTCCGDDDERVETLRNKLSRTPIDQIRELDIRLKGDYAGKYALALHEVAPRATDVTLEVPANIRGYKFLDLSQLEHITNLTLHKGAVQSAMFTGKLPRIQTVHLTDGHKTWCHARQGNAPEIRPLQVTLETTSGLFTCCGKHLQSQFPRARRHHVLHVSETTDPLACLMYLEMSREYFHTLRLRGSLPNECYAKMDKLRERVSKFMLECVHALAPVPSQVKALVSLGARIVKVDAYHPEWLCEQMRCVPLTDANWQVHELHILDAARPHLEPIIMQRTGNYLGLPARRETGLFAPVDSVA